MEFPQSEPFGCIVADPPWPYGTRDAIPRCQKVNGETAMGVGDTQYPFMPVSEIAALPVSQIAAPKSHLYLWCTNSFLVQAHEVAVAWGYEPKTVLTWGKVKRDGTPSMKTGWWFRGSTEHVVFATRGQLRLLSGARPTLYLSERLPHSVKPDWFFALCEECSPGPRLEMFARRRREGWLSWGNEV